jgi:hypothetical protein
MKDEGGRMNEFAPPRQLLRRSAPLHAFSFDFDEVQ